MNDVEFKIKEKCRTEGTRVKLKKDFNSYIYIGCANNGDGEVQRILKRADRSDSILKIVNNEEYLENVYLDYECLENMKSFKEELEKDFGFNNNPEKFFNNYILFKKYYNKVQNREEKHAFSQAYHDYEKGLKDSVKKQIINEFSENKDVVEFISNLTLDLVFFSFVFPIDMELLDKEKK